MSSPTDQLLSIAISEAPVAISLLKDLFNSRNPGVPTPTSEEVIAAWTSAFQSSLAKDEAWLAAHPE